MNDFNEIKFKGDYINGSFSLNTRTTGTFASLNPGNTNDALGQIDFCVDHVASSIESAKRGFKIWKTFSPEKRIGIFMAYKEKLIEKKFQLAELISRETGKPLWESEYEITNTIEFIDAVIDHMFLLVRKVDFKSFGWEYRPKGTFLLIAPYSSPFEIVNKHIIPTIIAGNTMI